MKVPDHVYVLEHSYTWSGTFVLKDGRFNFFPQYITNDTIFGKIYIEHKMRVLISSATLNTSHSKKSSATYYKRALVFLYSIRYSRHILIKPGFSGQIFETHKNTEVHENMSSGSRAVPCGRTDGTHRLKKLIVAFRNFASAHKKSSHYG
jgi:hypothetical protein